MPGEGIGKSATLEALAVTDRGIAVVIVNLLMEIVKQNDELIEQGKLRLGILNEIRRRST